MLIDLFILIICSIAITLLGLLILARNPNQANNRRFAFLSVALVAWSVSNYLSDHATSHVLLYTRLTFLSGVGAAYAVICFTANFPNGTALYKNLYLRLHTAFTVLLLPITLMPAFVKSVSIQPSHGSVNTSYLYPLFVIYVAYSLGLLFVIIRKQKLSSQSVAQKQQVSIVSWGIILYAIFAASSNVLLPLLINNWSSSRLGPAFTLLLVGMVAYAIIRHRLFDIRLIVARSIAYLTSILVLAAVYGLLVLGTSSIIFHLHFPVGVQIFIATVTAVASLSFANIKTFFDRTTNRLFFRDAYDTQAFLDEFNKTLVITYELDDLLRKSAETIEENIKPAHCLFIVNETANTKARTMSIGGKMKLPKEDMRDIRDTVSRTKQKLTVVDELESKHESLQKLLRNRDIALVAKLAVSSSGSRPDVGYLLFGPKKSGNLYSSQDLKVIEIVANELVIAVQNALRFEEIEQFNITLQGRVDEATKKLRRANEKLKALDETKDDFISMASHQLRTPLTSVKGYLSMLVEGDAGKVTHTQREMLSQAFFSSQRMVYLIADLLNISRLKTGKFVIEPAPVNLAEVVKQELGQLEETAASHSLSLTYDKPKTFPELMIDETKTRQVIMNFVDNAIYYTPAGGHISVRLIDNPNTVELRVEDDGIGVPKSEQAHLFTKFYRAGNARKARPDGTGLGLFMAKKVIVAQGGSLVFESQEGKGSTFGFIFNKNKLNVPSQPLAKPEPAKKLAKVS